MDTAFALKGKDFVLMVTDMTIPRSIFKLKENEDKTMVLDNNKLIALAGPVCDCKSFG